jgi:dTDP-4-dehydrorhamnose reductase
VGRGSGPVKSNPSIAGNEGTIKPHPATGGPGQTGEAVKTAVIGASGYIGRHLCKYYRAAHPDAVGTTFSSTQPGLTQFDIRQPALGALRLEESGHRAVLIASAKPNIEFCEREREAAYAVNVQGTIELIRQVSRTSMQVIFISSDYVFEGRTGQYDDGAEMGPTTDYGRQKAFVEKELPALTDNHLILRLSKIFGTEKGDRTLLDDIASSLSQGRRVRVARDQIFSPTHVGDIVRAVQAIQSQGLRGVLNVCSPESCSRHSVAQSLAQAMRVDPALVEAIGLHDIPAMANRPLNTSMKCSRLGREAGVVFRPLQESIDAVVKNWAPG